MTDEALTTLLIEGEDAIERAHTVQANARTLVKASRGLRDQWWLVLGWGPQTEAAMCRRHYDDQTMHGAPTARIDQNDRIPFSGTTPQAASSEIIGIDADI
jgi:hypothetical protein